MSSQAGASFIYSVLANDATLGALVGTRVYEDIAPRDANLPYVVFQMYAPNDVVGVGANRLWTQDLWMIKVIARQLSYKGDLQSAAKRVDALLHAADGSTVDGQVWACTREREVRYPETRDGGEQVRHLGGIYRILAS